MPYCKEFQDLFSSADFIEQLQQQNPGFGSGEIGITQIANAVNANDCTVTEKWLERLYHQYTTTPGTIMPLHIGLGNPDADILIVGMELAIEAGKPDPKKLNQCKSGDYYRKLHVNEILLNYWFWAVKVKGINITPNCCLQDPEFPPSFCHLYNDEKRLSHYWGICSRVIGAKLSRDITDTHNEKNIFRTRHAANSFFEHVFLTELHIHPSPNAPAHRDVAAIRRQFDLLTSNPFYKKFRRVVLGCNTYLNNDIINYDQSIMKSWQVSITSNNLSRNIREVFDNGNQRIIICNNLSGNAAWSHAEMQQLGRLLQ